MSVTLDGIIDGMVTNLGAVADVQVLGYIPSAPTPPCLYVYPDEVDYDLTMGRATDLYRLRIQAMVAHVADKGAQRTLNNLLDPASATSVKKAAESDKTLGGIVSDLRVTKTTGYRIYEVPNVGRGMSNGQLIGAEWAVEVYT